MRYYLHQGSFDFPFPFEDHTSNALLVTNPESNETVQVTVIRDRLESGEDMDAYLKRQYKLIGKKIPGYAELSRKPVAIGETGLEGLQMEARSKENGYVISQIQTVILMPGGPDILIATVGIPGPLNAGHREWWGQFINSFALPKYED
ncbi:MAG: hypothetical protein DELT_02618 [Desulfovibrio sp.]